MNAGLRLLQGVQAAFVAASGRPCLLSRGIQHDAIEPGRERRARAKLLAGLIHPQEALLRDVFRRRTILR